MNAIENNHPSSKGRIAIVEPISSGVALINQAKSMGLEVIVASRDCDECCLPKTLRSRIDSLIVVDTNDETALTKTLVSLARDIQLDAVLPGFEYFVPVVSRINAILNLPGLPPESVDNVRIKSLMRQRLQSLGVRVPAYCTANSLSELEKAAFRIGFPAVLKPIDSAGSIHVSRVDSMAALSNAFAALKAETRTDLDQTLSEQVQLESYINGPEFSVEGFVHHSQIHVVSITQKFLSPEPYFVELGHIVGVELPPETEQLIQDYVAQVVEALGVTLGPIHCELRLGCEGPVLMELAARLPGDRICELIALARGVSLPRVMIESYLGRTPSITQTTSKADRFAGIRFFIAPGLTHYTKVTGLKEIETQPGFVKSRLTIQAGEPIPPLIDFRGRLGFAMFTASNYHEMRDKFTAVDRLISFA